MVSINKLKLLAKVAQLLFFHRANYDLDSKLLEGGDLTAEDEGLEYLLSDFHLPHLLLEHLIKPRMLQRLLECYPRIWVGLKEAVNQVFGFFRDLCPLRSL